jgi:hypothetical protein
MNIASNVAFGDNYCEVTIQSSNVAPGLVTFEPSSMTRAAVGRRRLLVRRIGSHSGVNLDRLPSYVAGQPR